MASFLALLFNFGLHYDTTERASSGLTFTETLQGTIIILPLAVSAISLAFSLFSLYRLTPIYENVSLIIIIAHTLIAFPFANRIITAARSNIDNSLINVSRSLGATRFQTFIKIEMPILLSGIIAAGIFSFAISIGEFGATTFLARSNFATIPVGIYRLINTRNIGSAAAFSTILIVLVVISFIVIEKLGRLELRL